MTTEEQDQAKTTTKEAVSVGLVKDDLVIGRNDGRAPSIDMV